MRYHVDTGLRKRVVDQLLQRETEDTGRGEARNTSLVGGREQAADLPVLHVSDLIVSLPQAWYRMHGGEETFTESSRQNMALGVGVQGILRSIPGLQTEVEVKATSPQGARLVGHVDGVEMVDGRPVPWEVKTTRSGYKNAPSVHYYEQLGAYAYMLQATRGVLLTVHRADNEIFKVGLVEWEPEELADWWEELTRRAYLLLTAKDAEELGDEQYSWSWGYSPAGFQERYPDLKGGTYNGFFGAAL